MAEPATGTRGAPPPHATDNRLPCLAWVEYRNTLSLTVGWAVHSQNGWAAPERLDAGVAATGVQSCARRDGTTGRRVATVLATGVR